MAIKGYKIIREIYRGPVTTVYQAKHQSLERSVLLKILNIQWREAEDLINRFTREAKIGARLDHPNVVRIFDFKASGDAFFISMEFIDGINLYEFVKKHHPLPFSEILYITINILHGLAYAHSQNAIHRDIKPSNIMIANSGEIKITDFGLAVISDLPQITEQGQTVGSPSYMSPEQALSQSLDARTDLFSLGTTLYELCSSVNPFISDNIGTTIQNILNKPPVPLQELRPDIPVWFVEFTHQLLQKNRDDRPAGSDSALNEISLRGTKVDVHEFSKFISTNNTTTLQVKTPSAKSFLSRKQIIRTTPLFVSALLILFWIQWDITSAGKPEDSQPSFEATPISAEIDTQIMKSPSIISADVPDLEAAIIVLPNKAADQIGQVTDTSRIAQDQIDSGNVVLPGKLYIVAKPWANIYINDIFRDTTPLNSSMILDPGKYKIELQNPNFESLSKEIELHPAQSETLIAEMKLKMGFLELRVSPWAEIFINGRYMETTPVDKPLSLPEGRHILTLKNPNFMSLSDTIEIFAGLTLNKRIRLKKDGMEIEDISNNKYD